MLIIFTTKVYSLAPGLVALSSHLSTTGSEIGATSDILDIWGIKNQTLTKIHETHEGIVNFNHKVIMTDLLIRKIQEHTQRKKKIDSISNLRDELYEARSHMISANDTLFYYAKEKELQNELYSFVENSVSDDVISQNLLIDTLKCQTQKGCIQFLTKNVGATNLILQRIDDRIFQQSAYQEQLLGILSEMKSAESKDLYLQSKLWGLIPKDFTFKQFIDASQKSDKSSKMISFRGIN